MRSSVHGVLMAVKGCGVLITGPAGAGKSQLGLELLDRGHQFVADDRVWLESHQDRLLGRGDAELGGFLALRCGLLVDVADQFGGAAVLHEHPVDFCVSPGPAQDPFTPVPREPFLDTARPRHHLAYLPGGAICIEALARAHQLERHKHGAAERFALRQAHALKRNSA